MSDDLRAIANRLAMIISNDGRLTVRVSEKAVSAVHEGKTHNLIASLNDDQRRQLATLATTRFLQLREAKKWVVEYDATKRQFTATAPRASRSRRA